MLVTTANRRMKARKQSACPGCGGLINRGNYIYLWDADGYFICGSCALKRHTPPPPAPPGSCWADLMYEQLGGQLADTAYKVLARVLHPDAGGTHDAMTALNLARDRAHAKGTAA